MSNAETQAAQGALNFILSGVTIYLVRRNLWMKPPSNTVKEIWSCACSDVHGIQNSCTKRATTFRNLGLEGVKLKNLGLEGVKLQVGWWCRMFQFPMNNTWNVVNCNFNLRAPETVMKHPLSFITHVEQNSSRLLQRPRQHSENIAERPKLWLCWLIQTISSAWIEFPHPTVIHCLVPPHWHATARLFPRWLWYRRYLKDLKVWPSMAQLEWL